MCDPGRTDLEDLVVFKLAKSVSAAPLTSGTLPRIMEWVEESEAVHRRVRYWSDAVCHSRKSYFVVLWPLNRWYWRMEKTAQMARRHCSPPTVCSPVYLVVPRIAEASASISERMTDMTRSADWLCTESLEPRTVCSKIREGKSCFITELVFSREILGFSAKASRMRGDDAVPRTSIIGPETHLDHSIHPHQAN